MHGRELLWHHWPFGCHCCLRYWEVLIGFGCRMHKLPNGSVSSIDRFDELQQLSHGHLSRLDRLNFVRKLRGVHGRELLRYNWSLGRNCFMRYWSVLIGFGCRMHKLPNGPVSTLYRQLYLEAARHARQGPIVRQLVSQPSLLLALVVSSHWLQLSHAQAA